LPTFTLPEHLAIDADTLRAIARRHGLDAEPIERLPEPGIVNAIYRLGERAILRVPRHHPNFVEDGRREAVADPPDDRWHAIGPIEPAALLSSDEVEPVGGAAHV